MQSTRRRGPLYWSLIGFLALCALAVVALASAGSHSRTPVDCTQAVPQVQRYQPPGARQPLLEMLRSQLAVRESSGYRVDGWPPAEAASGGCLVQFRYQARNATTTLSWSYDPRTGRVDALDDKTKQMSGW